MAKGNLFLGTATKKLGDVVMIRSKGEQLARVRVRKITNPKTEAQALQRCYFAPTSRFYAPLASVLETSWEGHDRSTSHNAFTSTAVSLARKNGWYLPKGESFFPLPYQVSKGILSPLRYSFATNAIYLMGFTELTATSTIADLTAKMVAGGLYQEGDQITVICVTENGGIYRPAWCRFILSSSSSVKLTEISTQIPFSIGSISQYTGMFGFGGASTGVVAGAFIVSRYERGKWLRSSQYLEVNSTLIQSIMTEEARQTAIASYRDGTGLVSSDVYLNGSTGASVDTSLVFSTRNLEGPSLNVLVSPVEVVTDGTLKLLQAVKVADGSSISLGIGKYSSQGAMLFLTASNEFVARPTDAPSIYIIGTSLSADGVAWLAAHGVPSSVWD